MKQFSTAVLSLLVAAAACNPLVKKDTCQTNDLGIPAGCMRLKPDGVPFGWLPDDMAGTKMSQINKDTGKQACFYGRYAQITSSGGWDGSQILSVMDDVVASKAVFIASVMPIIPFNQINDKIASDIANVMNKIVQRGVTVYLRFGHEMNWYASKDGNTYHGTAAEFVKAWRLVHDHVKDIKGCLMFWSPNIAGNVADYAPWWPNENYVDIVGLDVYPGDPNKSFGDVYGAFYNAYSKKYNKHFIIGETGANAADVASKEAWLKNIANADMSQYPCYQGVSWFEYFKDGHDFRIIEGQSADTKKKSLANFQ